MHTFMKQTSNHISLQETKATLILRGITLTPEDFRALKETQLLVCNKRKWIETSSTMLEQILAPFLNSPYMSLLNYVMILKSTIIVYYETRSRFDWHITDERIIEELHAVYIQHQGDQTIEYLRIVLTNLKKVRDSL